MTASPNNVRYITILQPFDKNLTAVEIIRFYYVSTSVKLLLNGCGKIMYPI